jgi:hypothetical protein
MATRSTLVANTSAPLGMSNISATELMINENISLAAAAHSVLPSFVVQASTGDVTILTVCVQITHSFRTRPGNSFCPVRTCARLAVCTLRCAELCAALSSSRFSCR